MPNYKKKASQQDRRVAEKTGLKIRPNSGAVKGYKGDLGGPDIFIETKTRDSVKSNLYLEIEWLQKARDQAFSMGKPIYCLVISSGDDTDYVVIEDKSFLKVTESIDSYGVDYLFTDLPRTLNISVVDLDRILYHRRKDGYKPQFRAYFTRPEYGLTIMYLEDFMELYQKRL